MIGDEYSWDDLFITTLLIYLQFRKINIELLCNKYCKSIIHKTIQNK